MPRMMHRTRMKSLRQPEIRIIPLRVQGEVQVGDSIAIHILSALKARRATLLDGDILIVKHKIVSKAEGAVVALDSVKPSTRAKLWAKKNSLDARVVELALSEARSIVRRHRKVMITETRHGFVCANSGVDVSNVDGGKSAVLLPKDPDRSAQKIRRALKQKLSIAVPVIITDSFGRPWREGLTEVAIGVAGMKPLVDYRGRKDAQGYSLHSSIEAIADELACAAGLVCGKLEQTPACIIRGFRYQSAAGTALELIRPAAFDLFR